MIAAPENDELDLDLDTLILYIRDNISVTDSTVAKTLEGNETCLDGDYLDSRDNNYDGHTSSLLAAAARRGNVSIVSLLLRSGMDPNTPVSQYDLCTPLMLAAKGGHTAVIRALIKDPRIQPHKIAQGHNALSMLVKGALEGNITPEQFQDSFTALTEAGIKSLPGFFKVYYKRDPDTKEESLQWLGDNIFIEAIYNSPTGSLKSNIAKDLESKYHFNRDIGHEFDDQEELTPAILSQYIDTAAPLDIESAKKRIKAENRDSFNRPIYAGNNPQLADWRLLTAAAHCGHGDVAALLIELGADPNQPMKQRGGNETALTLAAKKGHHHVIKILATTGALTQDKMRLAIQYLLGAALGISTDGNPIQPIDERLFLPTLQALIAAGADIRAPLPNALGYKHGLNILSFALINCPQKQLPLVETIISAWIAEGGSKEPPSRAIDSNPEPPTYLLELTNRLSNRRDLELIKKKMHALPQNNEETMAQAFARLMPTDGKMICLPPNQDILQLNKIQAERLKQQQIADLCFRIMLFLGTLLTTLCSAGIAKEEPRVKCDLISKSPTAPFSHSMIDPLCTQQIATAHAEKMMNTIIACIVLYIATQWLKYAIKLPPPPEEPEALSEETVTIKSDEKHAILHLYALKILITHGLGVSDSKTASEALDSLIKAKDDAEKASALKALTATFIEPNSEAKRAEKILRALEDKNMIIWQDDGGVQEYKENDSTILLFKRNSPLQQLNDIITHFSKPHHANAEVTAILREHGIILARASTTPLQTHHGAVIAETAVGLDNSL